jgi:hypothetical protein
MARRLMNTILASGRQPPRHLGDRLRQNVGASLRLTKLTLTQYHAFVNSKGIDMAIAKHAAGGRRKRSAKRAVPKRKAKDQTTVPLSPVRASFYARAVKIVQRIATTAPEEGLTEALSASTDAGALARALSNSDVLGSSIRDLEPLAAVIAKGAEHKQELIAEAGGLLTTADVAAALGISRQAVWKQRQERKLLSVLHGGEEKFPAVQFTSAGELLPGLARVLAAIRLQGGWGTLDFLVTPDDDELDGLSPIQVLKEGPERLEDVVRLAATQGEHGAG